MIDATDSLWLPDNSLGATYGIKHDVEKLMSIIQPYSTACFVSGDVKAADSLS